jgi:hypothetical protein
VSNSGNESNDGNGAKADGQQESTDRLKKISIACYLLLLLLPLLLFLFHHLNQLSQVTIICQGGFL